MNDIFDLTYFRNRENLLEFRFTVIMVSDLGSGVSVWTSDMFSVRGNVVCLVGVLCGSFVYEKPIFPLFASRIFIPIAKVEDEMKNETCVRSMEARLHGCNEVRF